jgi:hypothetical protein
MPVPVIEVEHLHKRYGERTAVADCGCSVSTRSGTARRSWPASAYSCSTARCRPNLRVGEALQLFSSFYERPADWRELLDVLGLGPQAGTRFGKLSGGQQQRLCDRVAVIDTGRVIRARN